MALVSNLARTNLLRATYLNSYFQPTRQFKSALKIKWVRPEKIPCIKPEVSGDLVGLGTLEMTQLPTPYKESKELTSADEIVQRLYSLEFFNRKMVKDEFIIQYANRVKAHRLDDDSPEVKISNLTVTIRNLQIHIDKRPKDKVNKSRLKIFIDKRNKYLSALRKSDYKKFEWLLDKLDIQHRVFGYNETERVERKKSLRRLTMLYITKLKNERLAEYKKVLESQKEGFLTEKLEKLIWIQNTEKEHGVEPTVLDSDIEAVRKQLQELQLVKPKEIVE